MNTYTYMGDELEDQGKGQSKSGLKNKHSQNHKSQLNKTHFIKLY